MVKNELGWVYFNDEWNMDTKETKENDIPHSDIRRMESEGVRKKNSDGISQRLSDDGIYEDGVDELSIVQKSDNYNDLERRHWLDDYDY